VELWVRRLLINSALIVTAAACGAGKEEPPPTRSAEEQRTVDSTVGASAKGVRGAMAASDSAAKRARERDSLSRLP
jgi:hypothetical protein